MSDIQDTRPWYKQFWPWFIAFPPAAAVVAGLITAWLAGAGPALVVDDYGQIGKVTAQRAFRDERAAALGLVANVNMVVAEAGEQAIVSVDLDRNASGYELPRAVLLRIVHPTREDLDTDVVLGGSGGHYAGRITRPAGRLYIHLSDVERSWRLVGELRANTRELELVGKQSAAGRAVPNDSGAKR